MLKRDCVPSGREKQRGIVIGGATVVQKVGARRYHLELRYKRPLSLSLPHSLGEEGQMKMDVKGRRERPLGKNPRGFPLGGSRPQTHTGAAFSRARRSSLRLALESARMNNLSPRESR